MNVLSLFDGMSCGQLALQRSGIPYDSYYASEIDPYAIKVTQHNFPNTIQIGDITAMTCEKTSELPKIDLLLGGSPCQGLSVAGKRLGFDDPRSALFYEYSRIKHQLSPKYFLLENVKMKQFDQDIISELMGVEPVEINSSLVSAQNRKRLYWTNIPFTIPEDRKIMLSSIIESGIVDTEKSYCLDACYYKGSQNGKLYLTKGRRQIVLTELETIIHNLYGGFKEKFPRIFNDKSPTIRTASGGGHIPSVFLKAYYKETGIILDNRLLTPVECERLQTVPDNYTSVDGTISKTQRYKMLGNGWTIAVISAILQNIKET